MLPDVFAVTSYTWNPVALPPALTTVVMLLLAIIIFLRERLSWVSATFFVMILPIAVWLFAFSWMYCAADERVALWWAKAAYVGVPCIPSAIYHFTVSILRSYPRWRWLVWSSWLTSVGFALAILNTDWLIQGLYHYWWGYYPKYGWLSVPYLTFFFGMMIVTFVQYWAEYRSLPRGTPHSHRVRAFLIAFSIVYLGSVDYLAKYGIPLYPFGYVPVLAFLILAAKAIWRYRLVNITPAFAASHIVETMADALLVFNHDGVVCIANQAACRLFGRTPAELFGKSIRTLWEPLFPLEDLKALLAAQELHDYEVTSLGTRGQPLVLSVSTSVIHDQTSEPMGIVCIARDITERQRAAQELRKTNELLAINQTKLLRTLAQLKKAHHDLQTTQLRLAQAAKLESVGRLAAGVAHEVKNPLAIILVGTEYLSKHLTATNGHRVEEVLRDIRAAVQKADAVIRGLLDFSSPKTLQIQRADLHPVIEQALWLLKHAVDRSHVVVVKELAPSLPPLYQDGDKLQQAFVNLFMNALDAMPNGGALRIHTYATRLEACDEIVGQRTTDRFAVGETVVTVDIEDTGTGIPEALLSKVFDPFFTTKPTGQGTGLGLAVTKTIVELHGGTIDIRNRPEGGVHVKLMFKVGKGGGARDGQEADSRGGR